MDVGRKFFSMSYLQDLVKVMSYYKLNSLRIHLNDNGTRLLSYLTFERMTDLGYFDEIIAAKQLYSDAEDNDKM